MKDLGKLVEEYLNEKYKDSEIVFIVNGLYIKAMRRIEPDNFFVDATANLPYIDKLSDEYKQNLDERFAIPVINCITKRIEKEKEKCGH